MKISAKIISIKCERPFVFSNVALFQKNVFYIRLYTTNLYNNFTDSNGCIYKHRTLIVYTRILFIFLRNNMTQNAKIMPVGGVTDI